MPGDHGRDPLADANAIIREVLSKPYGPLFRQVVRGIELRHAAGHIVSRQVFLPGWWPLDTSPLALQMLDLSTFGSRRYSLDALLEITQAYSAMEAALSPRVRCRTLEEVHAAYREGIAIPPGVAPASVATLFPFLPDEDSPTMEARRNDVALTLVLRFGMEREAKA